MRTPRVVRASLDALCADGHVLALAVFDRDSLHTAALARRKGSEFDLIAGPDVLGDVARGPAWRHRVPDLTRVISERVGPVGFGCFGELAAVRELLVGSPPGSFVRAVLAKDIVLSPPTMVSGLALGVDAMAGLLLGLRRASQHVAFVVTVFRWLDVAAFRIGRGARRGDGASFGLDAVSALRVLLAR